MTPSDMRSLVERFAAGGLVAPAPLVRRGGRDADGGHSPLGVIADIVVDLAEALDHAERIGVEGLDIYADTLMAPASFDRRLNGAVRRLTVATRRIVTDGRAALRMVHDEDNALSAVRLFVEQIEGEFSLFGGPRGRAAYDITVAAGSAEPPHFSNFGWRDKTAIVGRTAIPPGLLVHGEPLHRVLATLFALSAAIVGNPSPTASELKLCHETLGWITRWSGVETGFGELIRAAASLKALLPTLSESGRVAKPIPGLAAERYLVLAKAQQDVMAAMEDTIRSLDGGGDMSRLVGSVVIAFADRDTSDLGKLDAQREELEQRLREQIAALDRASRTMRQEEFDAEISAMQLELANKLAQIKRLVKLGFQIATALGTVAASFALLCVGVPANPNAGTQKGIDGVKRIGEMFTEAKQLGSTITGPVEALQALMRSFLIPAKWAKKNAATLMEFVDPAKSVLGAALPVLHGPVRDLDTTAIATELGAAMRALAELPDANEAKAAWTALEVDIVNRLDLVLNDAEAEPEVKKAASAFKTRSQRVAIYGRLLAEQMAAKTAIARQLAALKLEYLAVLAKRQRLGTLSLDISNQAETRARIRAETALRAESASRGFFVAGYGARAAQTYETDRRPVGRLAMAETTADMATALATARTEYETARATQSKVGSFTRELVIADAALLEKLSAGQPVRVDIGIDHPELARFRTVRLASVQAWLELAEPLQQRVAINLVSGGTFLDRGESGVEEFVAAPQMLRFEYRGTHIEFAQTLQEVLPTPFTTWVVELVEPERLPTPARALRLVLAGHAAV